jgi:dienelactone hydrolase
MKNTLVLIITLLLGGFSALAQDTDCPGTSPAIPDRSEVYAVADDGLTLLHWDLWLPATTPAPVVLVIHVGGYKLGIRGPGSIAADLAQHGFIAAAIDYRLDAFDPTNPVTANSLAYADNVGAQYTQVSDVKKAILAARDPTSIVIPHHPASFLIGKTTGKVGAVGGSAGGSHAFYCAITGMPDRDRLDCAALLSGAYQFDDLRSLKTTNTGPVCRVKVDFNSNVSVYCGLPGPVDTNKPLPKVLTMGSPLYPLTQMSQSDAQSIPPLFLIATDNDPITPYQIDDLKSALDRLRVRNYFETVITDSCCHAFEYWKKIVDGAEVNETVSRWLWTNLQVNK